MFVFLIVVVSLACGSAPPRSVALASIVASLAALVSLWTLLARSAADRAIADVDRGGRIALATERLQRQLERLRWAAIAGAVVGLLGFGLAGAVQTWPYFSQSMVLQTVVLLAPAHLLIAATLWAERRFDGAMGRAAVGFPAMARDVIAALARLDGWMIAPILVLLGLATLYHLGAPWHTPWRRDLPGAVLAMALWLAAAAALRAYLAFSVQDDAAYSQLAVPIAVVLWLYLTALAVLLGAEVNAVIEKMWPHERHPWRLRRRAAEDPQ